MSASREKKLRQGTDPVQKASGAKQQTNTSKNKTMLYTAAAVIVVVLIAALLIWDSAIIQRNSTAAKIGDTSYSPAEVAFYYNTAYQELALYAQYGLTSFDPNLAPKDQTVALSSGEEVTYHDYFIDSALNSLSSVTALYDAAIAAGYTESDVADTVNAKFDETEAYVRNNGYTSLKQWIVTNWGKIMTTSIYRDIVTREALADLYVTDYTASLEYTDDELKAYYDEHTDELDTFDSGFIYFPADSVDTKDADGNDLTDAQVEEAKKEALEAAKAKAESAAKTLTNGKLAEKAALLEQLIEETNPSYSSVVDAQVGSDLSGMVYFDWLKDSSRVAGDVTVAESEGSGYYVVLYMDRYLDETPSAKIRHLLIKATAADGSSSTPTQADMDYAKTQIDLLMNVWEAEGATEEAFAALADANSQDSRDASGALSSPGGLYTSVYKGQFVPNLDEWIFNSETRKPGSASVIENNGDSGYYGYHAVYFCGYNEGDFAWKATAKSALSSTDTDAYVSELLSNYTVSEESGIKYVFP